MTSETSFQRLSLNDCIHHGYLYRPLRTELHGRSFVLKNWDVFTENQLQKIKEFKEVFQPKVNLKTHDAIVIFTSRMRPHITYGFSKVDFVGTQILITLSKLTYPISDKATYHSGNIIHVISVPKSEKEVHVQYEKIECFKEPEFEGLEEKRFDFHKYYDALGSELFFKVFDMGKEKDITQEYWFTQLDPEIKDTVKEFFIYHRNYLKYEKEVKTRYVQLQKRIMGTRLD